MTKVYSKLYNKCETPLSIPIIKRDVDRRWDTNWDSLNSDNCFISLGIEHGEAANRFNTAEIQQMDFHLTKKSKHVSEHGIGKWYTESWKTIARICKTYGFIKALINNARMGHSGLFLNASRVLEGEEVFDNANCNVHAEHIIEGRAGTCKACDLIHDIRMFQLSWESVSRNSNCEILEISNDILLEFIKLLIFMIKLGTFPNAHGGLVLGNFMANVDEVFVHIFKTILCPRKDNNYIKKEWAKLDTKAGDYIEISGFYQKLFQHVQDDISVDWFSGPGGDGDDGFIMGTRIRIIVATFRTFSLDLERILNSRITGALDILGRPRNLNGPDNVLMIGSSKRRVKRRWSEGDDLIYNDRNEICRTILYEFLNGINSFRNFQRDPEAVFFLHDN